MTYQICLQSIIQCVEYEFAVVKFVEQDCQKQKDICVILWMYITPPPPLSTTDIGLTTALISEEQTILVQIQRDGHLGFWGFLHPFDILQYFH